jgi:hypothetical protein
MMSNVALTLPTSNPNHPFLSQLGSQSLGMRIRSAVFVALYGARLLRQRSVWPACSLGSYGLAKKGDSPL